MNGWMDGCDRYVDGWMYLTDLSIYLFLLVLIQYGKMWGEDPYAEAGALLQVSFVALSLSFLASRTLPHRLTFHPSIHEPIHPMYLSIVT